MRTIRPYKIAFLFLPLLPCAPAHAENRPIRARTQSIESAMRAQAQQLQPGTAVSPSPIAPAPAVEARPIADQPLPDVVAKAEPSVATILIDMTMTRRSWILGGRRIIGLGRSLGTGFLVRPDGLLVTNAHVVGSQAMGQKVFVQFYSDHIYRIATIVAKNPLKDLALIKLDSPREDGKDWPALPLGQSLSLRPLDPVIAVGSPEALRDTVTFGYVSRIGMDAKEYVGRYLQIQAPINHGNSGGPLLDKNGRVVGVNFAGYNPSKTTLINFAIPVEYVIQALKQFESDPKRPLRNASAGIQLAAINWMAPNGDRSPGVVIEGVVKGSGAQAAKLEPGDRIIAIDGTPLPDDKYDAAAYTRIAIMDKLPGDIMTLKIRRRRPTASTEQPITQKTEELDIDLKLDERKDDDKN